MKIAFIDPIPWDYSVATAFQRPLGGSQSAACYLACALAKRGHDIRFLTNASDPQLFRGVRCSTLNAQSLKELQTSPPDVAILINAVAIIGTLKQLLLPPSRLVLWTQHDPRQPAVVPLKDPVIQQQFDAIALVSQWQMNQYHQAYGPMRPPLALLRNAIAPWFETIPWESLIGQKEQSPTLAYTSSPFRGLERLVKAAFPQLRAAVPDLRLRVFSDLQPHHLQATDEPEFQQLVAFCKSSPGIDFVGTLPQQELASELSKCHIWSYPCTFPETLCISAMEAMASGCAIVCPDLGALVETTGGFARVCPTIGKKHDPAQFIEAVRSVVTDFHDLATADRIRDHLEEQVVWIRQNATWDRRAVEWEEWLETLFPSVDASRLSDEEIDLSMAASFQDAGYLNAAEDACHRILSRNPDHPQGLHLLGLIAYSAGRMDAAAELLQRAIQKRPEDAVFHCDLAAIRLGQQRFRDAISHSQTAVTLRPNFAAAYLNWGNALQFLGDFPSAIATYRRALEIDPQYVEALNCLGVAYFRSKRIEQAEAAYRRAIDLRPDFIEAENNLGELLLDQDRVDEAAVKLERAAALAPGFITVQQNFARALLKQRDWARATEAFQRVLKLTPRQVEAWVGLGECLWHRGQFDDARRAFTEALNLHPGNIAALYGLGVILKSESRPNDAADCFRKILSLQPDHVSATNNLAVVLSECGMVEEGLQLFERAVTIAPNDGRIGSNRLMAEHYNPANSPAGLSDLHQQWAARFAGSLPVSTFPAPKDPDRPLRLAFVSADLRQHPVGLLLVGAFEALRGKNVQTTCYFHGTQPDEVTQRFKDSATAWRDVPELDDESLVARIKADEIDFLFDLGGHTHQSRLGVFARRAAPFQLTWLGYVGTTGLATMDFLVADRFHVPEAYRPFYRENVLWLDGGYACFEPPKDAPEVSVLPGLDQSIITFGSFNNPNKLNLEVIATWCRILNNCPQSQLLLKYSGLDDPFVADAIRQRFAKCGGSPDRILFEGYSPRPELLAAYRRVDIGLDPFPYSGGLTTCEALWMGVPVVTVPSETFASRHAFSYLSSAGVTGTIAGSVADYVEIALSLAANRDRLAALRTQLRDKWPIRRSVMAADVRVNWNRP